MISSGIGLCRAGHCNFVKVRPPCPGDLYIQLRVLGFQFDPCIRGSKHCRPMISIDATHLYGKYKGKLSIAMATDGNN